MSVTASPALITASCAAATNERPAGYRRNSEVWDKNTRRGGGSVGITQSIAALTQRENTNPQADVSRVLLRDGEVRGTELEEQPAAYSAANCVGPGKIRPHKCCHPV